MLPPALPRFVVCCSTAAVPVLVGCAATQRGTGTTGTTGTTETARSKDTSPSKTNSNSSSPNSQANCCAAAEKSGVRLAALIRPRRRRQQQQKSAPAVARNGRPHDRSTTPPVPGADLTTPPSPSFAARSAPLQPSAVQPVPDAAPSKSSVGGPCSLCGACRRTAGQLPIASVRHVSNGGVNEFKPPCTFWAHLTPEPPHHRWFLHRVSAKGAGVYNLRAFPSRPASRCLCRRAFPYSRQLCRRLRLFSPLPHQETGGASRLRMTRRLSPAPRPRYLVSSCPAPLHLSLLWGCPCPFFNARRLCPVCAGNHGRLISLPLIPSLISTRPTPSRTRLRWTLPDLEPRTYLLRPTCSSRVFNHHPITDQCYHALLDHFSLFTPVLTAIIKHSRHLS
ncbi:hypothetical protein BCR34DRAFT_243246 [Clohesyomyces aquaticus]|uniref:Uncharacterized protein n=1 Tax=Clohesyomyces aquaticus TaxID=1231657 RepID=A0A1Y1Y588_9PLEO|nr:hypothetical protein BCR34DRAFT_243246 [Clohesyomyces aquaticus]